MYETPMATSNREPAVHPLRYVAGTVIFTLFGAAVIGVLTVVVFGVAQRAGSPFPHLYLASLLGFALLLSQELFSEDLTGNAVDRSDYQELPLYQTMLVFLFGIVFYNLLLFVALFVTALGVTLGGERLVYLIAFLYPVYDVKTGTKMNPLSVFGSIAWIATALYLVGWVSRNVVDVVREIELEPFRIVETLRYRRPG